MDQTNLIIEAFTFVHVVGLCVGLGGALFADLIGLRQLFGAQAPFLLPVIRRLHVFIGSGLGAIWISGVVILLLKFGLADIPGKIYTKYVLVTAITLNALLIGRVVLPAICAGQAPLAGTLPPRTLASLVIAGATSFVGWTATLLVAKFSALQAMPTVEILSYAVVAWGMCLFALTAAILVFRCFPPVRQVASRWRPSSSGTPTGPGSGTADRSAMAPIGRGGGTIGFTSLRSRSRPARDTAGPTENRSAQEKIVPHPSAVKTAPVRPERALAKATVGSALAACRSALWSVGRISLVTNLLMLTGPLFMLQVYDRVLTSQSIPTLAALLTIVAFLFVFVAVLDVIRSRVLVRVGARIDRLLRDRVFDAAVRVAPADDRKSRSAVLGDLDRVRQFIASPGPIAAFDMPWAPVYFAVIFLFHWMLGMVALAGAAFLIVLSLANQWLSRRPSAAASGKMEDSIAMADAGGRNAETLHALGMANTYRNRWLQEHRAAVALHVRASDINATFYVLSRVTRLFLQSLMLAAGAYLAIAEAITPGVMIAASIILSRALSPIEQVIGQWRGFISARQGVVRIGRYIDALPHVQPSTSLPDPQARLSVEGAYAAPPGLREPILKDISFALEPGNALGVIGPSASGKSTLARMLVGVWPTMRGAVRLDGAALETWPPDHLGRHIGYLAQETSLFEGTVADNIARFDPTRDDQAVFEAAELAGVRDLVLRLPGGFDTMLGTRGFALSGGQRQRIALARALYRNPALIVLDEPNANLDQEGDLALLRAIERLRQAGRAVVIISHKDSVLSAVSHLMVLKNGRCALFGPVRDVLADFLKQSNGKGERSNVTPLKKTPFVAS